MSEESEEVKLNKDLETKVKLLNGSAVEGVTHNRGRSWLIAKENRTVEDENPQAVEAWGKGLDEEIVSTDEAITRLTNAVSEVRSLQFVKEKEKEHALKEKEREDQLKFEKRRYEQKLEFERKLEESSAVKGQTCESKLPKTHSKLPELKITKFNGDVSTWLTFWNKFEAEIDKSDLAPTTKFAYLKEMLESQIRAEVDGLPFSIEGYERAKTILQSEYGKQSEIVNSYIRNIMNLPVITSNKPSQVHEFYKTLLFNVQSLETLGKLQDVKGNVRFVIDKLKGIRSDLVRGQGGWQIGIFHN